MKPLQPRKEKTEVNAEFDLQCATVKRINTD